MSRTITDGFAFRQSAPSSRQVAAIGSALDLGAAGAIVRLKGGLDTSTHRVDYEGGPVVLRRFDPENEWHSPAKIAREVAMLRELEHTSLPTPALLLVDVDGSSTGGPVLVMQLLPGEPGRPQQDVDWLAAFASTVAAVGTVQTATPPSPWVEIWRDPDRLDTHLVGHPRGADVAAGIDSCRAELERTATVLTHHDLHVGNTLWSQGRVSGIVDWAASGVGFEGQDAAYCAMDLAMCASDEASLAFLDQWRTLSGNELHPGWCLVAAADAVPDVEHWVPGWVEMGLDVTVAAAKAALSRWIDRALARL